MKKVRPTLVETVAASLLQGIDGNVISCSTPAPWGEVAAEVAFWNGHHRRPIREKVMARAIDLAEATLRRARREVWEEQLADAWAEAQEKDLIVVVVGDYEVPATRPKGHILRAHEFYAPRPEQAL